MIKWSNHLLGFLLTVDILFILGHIFIVTYLWLGPSSLLLDAGSSGYPEGFQYLKYLGLVLIIAYLVAYEKRFSYLPLFVLFAFLLVDDVYQLHTRAGFALVDQLNPLSYSGAKPEIIGQLAYVFIMAIFFIGLFIWSYNWTKKHNRKSLMKIFVFLGAFFFFGVGVDLLHTFLGEEHRYAAILTLIEEGGEMLTLSILVWHFCSEAASLKKMNRNYG